MTQTPKTPRSGKSTAKAEKPAETPPAQKKSHSFSSFLVFFLVLLLAGYGLWLYRIDGNPLEPRTQPVAEDERVTPSSLPTQPDEQTRKKLRTTETQLQQAFAEIEKLTTRVNGLATEVETLQNKPAPVATDAELSPDNQQTISTLQTSLAELQEQMATIQASQREQAGIHASTLHTLQLIDTLEKQLQDGAPYETTLQKLEKRATPQNLDQNALEDLLPFASIGIPTKAKLNALFEDVALIAVPMSLQNKENATFTDKMRSRLSHVVSIRRTDEHLSAEDSSDEAIIARAEAALNKGDVDAAVAQLELLSPEAAMLFSKWKDQATIHQDAWNALERLKSAMYATPAEQE